MREPQSGANAGDSKKPSSVAERHGGSLTSHVNDMSLTAAQRPTAVRDTAAST
jgi:hypothetical protein